jgi:dTDP-4-dehydrorhamnose 3,5-epimerase
MKFTKTKIKDAYIINLEKKKDSRGFFARVWDAKELKKLGLDSKISQANMSQSAKRGTMRGLHYQTYPFGEAKIIRCTKGAIYDVMIDLRPKSPSYLKWLGVKLTETNGKMVYVPKYCAHAFLTLEDNAEVSYMVSQFYTPKAERGIRYNDPTFKIKWPIKVTEASDKDKNWPDFPTTSRQSGTTRGKQK